MDLHRPVFVYDVGDASTIGPPIVWSAERRFVHLNRGLLNLERMVLTNGTVLVAPVCPHVWRGQVCMHGIHCVRIHVPADVCVPILRHEHGDLNVHYLTVHRMQHGC